MRMKQKTDKKYSSSKNVALQTNRRTSFLRCRCRCFRRIFLLCVCVIVGNTFAFCFEVVLLLKALCYPVYTTLYALLFTKCNARRHHHHDTRSTSCTHRTFAHSLCFHSFGSTESKSPSLIHGLFP